MKKTKLLKISVFVALLVCSALSVSAAQDNTEPTETPDSRSQRGIHHNAFHPCGRQPD